jgi:hypothetical protein
VNGSSDLSDVAKGRGHFARALSGSGSISLPGERSIWRIARDTRAVDDNDGTTHFNMSMMPSASQLAMKFTASDEDKLFRTQRSSQIARTFPSPGRLRPALFGPGPDFDPLTKSDPIPIGDVALVIESLPPERGRLQLKIS